MREISISRDIQAMTALTGAGSIVGLQGAYYDLLYSDAESDIEAVQSDLAVAAHDFRIACLVATGAGDLHQTGMQPSKLLLAAAAAIFH